LSFALVTVLVLHTTAPLYAKWSAKNKKVVTVI
jgi:hypothetical protein